MMRDNLLCVVVRCDFMTVVRSGGVNKWFRETVKSEMFLRMYKEVSPREYTRLRWLHLFMQLRGQNISIDSKTFGMLDAPIWFLNKYKGYVSMIRYCSKPNGNAKFIDKILKVSTEKEKRIYVGYLSGTHGSVWLLEKYIEYINWNYLCMSNSLLPISFYEKHIENVDWCALCENENIPISFYEKHFEKISWKNLCLNDSVPLQFFITHLGEKIILYIDDLCGNTNVTVEFIEKYIDYIIHGWRDLCCNSSIPIAFYEKHINRINWFDICTRTIKPDELWFYEKYMYKDMICNLVRNSSVPLWWLEKFMDNISGLSLRYGISTEYYEKHFDKFAPQFSYIQARTSDPDFLINHIDLIDTNTLSENTSIPYQCFQYLLHK